MRSKYDPHIDNIGKTQWSKELVHTCAKLLTHFPVLASPYQPSSRFGLLFLMQKHTFSGLAFAPFLSPHAPSSFSPSAPLFSRSSFRYLLRTLIPAIETFTDTAGLDGEAEVLRERMAGLYARIEALVDENAHRSQVQNEYQQQYEDLSASYEKVKSRLVEVTAEKQSRMARWEQLQRFIDTVRGRDALLCEFDEGLWRATVENITVHSLKDIRLKFRDGREIRADISKNPKTE